MSTFTKNHFSASVDGLPIKIASIVIGTPTLIHTALASTTGQDEIWLYAVNTSAAACKLTILWGGITTVDHTIEFTVAAGEGLKCIVPGLVIQNAKLIQAFAATTNVITILGFVNSIV